MNNHIEALYNQINKICEVYSTIDQYYIDGISVTISTLANDLEISVEKLIEYILILNNQAEWFTNPNEQLNSFTSKLVIFKGTLCPYHRDLCKRLGIDPRTLLNRRYHFRTKSNNTNICIFHNYFAMQEGYGDKISKMYKDIYNIVSPIFDKHFDIKAHKKISAKLNIDYNPKHNLASDSDFPKPEHFHNKIGLDTKHIKTNDKCYFKINHALEIKRINSVRFYDYAQNLKKIDAKCIEISYRKEPLSFIEQEYCDDIIKRTNEFVREMINNGFVYFNIHNSSVSYRDKNNKVKYFVKPVIDFIAPGEFPFMITVSPVCFIGVWFKAVMNNATEEIDNIRLFTKLFEKTVKESKDFTTVDSDN